MRTALKKRRWVWWLLTALAVGIIAGWRVHRGTTRLRATVLREQTIDVQGVPRHYRLVIPDSLDGQTPAPVLFAFHGAGDTPEEMARYTDLDQLAASEGFYLVYPQGRHLSWPPMILADNPEYVNRDLVFFDALCDALSERYRVDERRVYATGLSQGAAFVNLLVAKRSEKLAAAASHSGWLPDPLPSEGIHAQRKCPVMFIAGSKDGQIPPATVKEACECFQREGHPVQFCLIERLGHEWALEHGVNERIWRFLSRCALP
jgi:poly(3-hydroxybutyrate) depolymerase